MVVLHLGITYFTMFVEVDRVDLRVIGMSGNAWVFRVTKPWVILKKKTRSKYSCQ